MCLRLAIPDLISPSYFPAIAAVEMGFFEKEGFAAKLELLYPVTSTYAELREGRLDFVGGAAHAALYAFKDWRGGKLLCALAQHMYWFLVLSRKMNAKRGDRPGARRENRTGAGRCRRKGVLRADRCPGARGRQDRRLLGERHGRRGRGAQRHRHARARRPTRRQRGNPGLHLSRAGCQREARSERRCGGGPCRRRCAKGAERRPEPGYRGRQEALPADRSRADRRADPPRFSVLRSNHFQRERDRDEPLCAGYRPALQPGSL